MTKQEKDSINELIDVWEAEAESINLHPHNSDYCLALATCADELRQWLEVPKCSLGI